MARLVSVNVGLPKEIQWRGERVYTGIWKGPVEGPRWVRRLNVEGDGQGDLAGHGGEHRAVFVYQTSAYAFWADKLRRSDFSFSQFGENFTVDGLADDEVRIGDRYRIGAAIFEVTQPRVTCYRVGIRMNDPHMAARLVAEGRPGFYMRVLTEGSVAAGDAIELCERSSDGVTVADVDALLYRPAPDRDKVRQALRVRALSKGWRMSLEAIIAQPPDSSGAPGLVSTDPGGSVRPGFRAAWIAELSHITPDVVAVSLAIEDGSELDSAAPGQFIESVKFPLAAAASPRRGKRRSTPERKARHPRSLAAWCSSRRASIALDARDGRRLWSSTRLGPIHWESPAIAGASVYCADENGALTAFSLGSQRAHAGRPFVAP